MNSAADIFGVDIPYRPQTHSEFPQTETIVYISAWRNT